MAFVYVTPKAKEVAKHYGVRRDLDKLISDYEQRPLEQVLQLLEARFPYRYDHLRTASGKFAMVIQPVLVDTPEPLTAICLLTMFKCGDSSWEDFKDSATDDRKAKLEGLLDVSDLNRVIADAIARDKMTRERPKEPLPESTADWLQPLDDWSEGELLMESQAWVDCFALDAYARYWQDYHRLVSDAEQRPELGQSLGGSGRIRRRSDEGSGRSIYVAHLDVDGDTEANNTISVCFLISPYDPSAAERSRTEFETALLTDVAWIQRSNGVIARDEVARHACRSYPQYLLADEDIWYTLERDGEANLAYSLEESDLLRRVRRSESGDVVLPLFINGRAGSGKSTMLYHLFADYIYRKMTFVEPLEGDILFLTYNRRLRDTARSTVGQLVRSRTDFLNLPTTSSQLSPSGIQSVIEGSFWTFGRFVESQLEDVRRVRYCDDRRLDYRLFAQLYVGRDLPSALAAYGYKGRKDLSPALSWHAIRAFIKGYRYDRFLTPDEYDEIPRKERSVTPADYRTVYDQVWEPWCRSLVEQHGFWDVQQMAADLLRTGKVEPRYSVVFCDEAQDFTRTELSFILSLLTYRKYDLGWRRNTRMPLAFAGDPFQTINPTGFRWETLKASFYNEILVELDPLGRGTVDFDYTELTQNYRSQPSIVQLSNLVQLWREILLGLTDVLPQKNWSDSELSDTPMLFVLGNSISEAELLDVIQKTPVVIVPCEQDQEDDFVANDPTLSTLRKQYDALTVLSAMSAKGLEFPSVMLYKFGEFCSPDLMNRAAAHDLSDQYFLNKLYVAVTRAKRDLVIVDTPSGERNLWRHALEADSVEQWRGQSRRPDLWRAVSGIAPGKLIFLRWQQQDPYSLAESLHKTGEAEGNPRLLRQARPHYRRAGRDDLANLCEAKALEVEHQFEQAGEAFGHLEHYGDAERCFWRGMLWKHLQDLAAVYSRVDERRMVTARLMLSRSLDDAVTFLSYHRKQFEAGAPVPASEPQFQAGAREAINQVARALDKEPGSEVVVAAVDALHYMTPVYQVVGTDTVARLYYAAAQYGAAVAVWDSQPGGRPQSKAYSTSKARISPWPESVKWWVEAGEIQTVIEEYEAHRGAAVPNEIMETIAGAYRKAGRAKEAVEIYLGLGKLESVIEEIEREIPDEAAGTAQPISPQVVHEVFQRLLNPEGFERARRLLGKLASRWSEPTLMDYATEMITALVAAQDWNTAMAVTIPEGLKIQDVQRRQLAGLSPSRRVEIRMKFIERLAHSEELPRAHTKDKQKLSAYLDHIARDPERAWRQHLSLPKLSGAAEKVWRDIDILQYYEDLEKTSLSRSEVYFVHQRWLKVKARQIERLAAQTQEGSDGKGRTRSRRHELAGKAKEWAITLDEIDALPEYPDPDTKVYADVSMYKVEWRAPKCRITHKSTEGQITIDIATGKIMTFDAPEPVVSDEAAAAVRIFLDEWSLQGVLQRGQSFVFTLDNEHFSYELKRPDAKDLRPEEESSAPGNRG